VLLTNSKIAWSNVINLKILVVVTSYVLEKMHFTALQKVHASMASLLVSYLS